MGRPLVVLMRGRRAGGGAIIGGVPPFCPPFRPDGGAPGGRGRSLRDNGKGTRSGTTSEVPSTDCSPHAPAPYGAAIAGNLASSTGSRDGDGGCSSSSTGLMRGWEPTAIL